MGLWKEDIFDWGFVGTV